MIPAPDPFITDSRVAFAGYRPNGTNEVTTLGPEAEAQTYDTELNFGDLLDIANPLQHIPGLSSIYRSLTGDEISAPARILGAALYTGPVGFVFAAADAVFAEASGRYFGDALVAAVTGSSADDGAEPAAAVAGEPVSLEGADALAALARDLGAQRQPAPAPAPAAGVAAPPEAQRSPLFLQNMAKALDKYRALAQVRQPVVPIAAELPKSAPGVRTPFFGGSQPL